MALRASRMPEPKPAPPSPVERCDRSRQEEARWIVTGPSGKILTFCNHHYRHHEVALRVFGWTIQPIIKKGV